MWHRWIAAALVAIGLSLAGLELSACVAAERRAAAAAAASEPATDAIKPELPVAAEVGETELSAPPRLTY
jgi:hypothetical protein